MTDKELLRDLFHPKLLRAAKKEALKHRTDGCRLPAELRDVPPSHLASCDDYLTKNFQL